MEILGVFTDLGTASRAPPAWVIENLLPVGLTFIGAPPKCNKSTFTMAMAALVGGHRCKALPPALSKVKLHGPVMVFSAEATAAELRDMVEVGMRLSVPADESLLVCDEPFEWRLDDPGGVLRLEQWLNNRMPRMVVIDPLRDFHQMEERDSGQMNRLLRPLQRWCKANEAAAVIVHHTRKPSDQTPGDATDPSQLRGSSAMFGLADAVIMMGQGKDGFVRIRSTFKRAAGWEKQIRLAVYEYAELEAQEKVSPSEELVMKAVLAGMRDPAQISVQTRVSIPMVVAAMAKMNVKPEKK